MPYADPAAQKRYNAKYHQRNKDMFRKAAVESMRRCRADVIVGYGGECTCCGEDNEVFLCIDHINGDGAEERRRGIRVCHLYRRLRREGYPKDNYQLLCHNCNFAKSLRGGCPHGGTNGAHNS